GGGRDDPLRLRRLRRRLLRHRGLRRRGRRGLVARHERPDDEEEREECEDEEREGGAPGGDEVRRAPVADDGLGETGWMLHGAIQFAPLPPAPSTDRQVAASPSSSEVAARVPSPSAVRRVSSTLRWSSPSRAGSNTGSSTIPLTRMH